ncbi:caveolin-3-like [Liolophura sinensis]|uniref:caveolin-3-like n=1 Tax=Liolophura sinensis TaxID=3198878 RepID=UPI003158C818
MELEMKSKNVDRDVEMAGEQHKSPVSWALHLENRDPKFINSQLTVNFRDVLGEPEGIRSVDCVWLTSDRCFNLWKSLCYRSSTLLCGICLAISWGCQFAFIAFLHVWYITPLMKVMELNCIYAKRLYGLCIGCCLNPVFESIGNIFNAFKGR